MICAVLLDFGETLVERVVDDVLPLTQLDITPFPETYEVLQRLTEAGLRLALLSNTTQSTEQDLREVLRRHGLEQFFDAVLTSFDEGVRKPEPAIYERALALLGCRPEEGVMVGNDLVQDIAGAAALGMRTILIAGSSVRGRSGDVVPNHTIASLLELPALLDV